MFRAIGFDADDTLWHNEVFFKESQKKFKKILNSYSLNGLYKKLLEIEKNNITLYGYGVKGFILSMIETAIIVSNNNLNGRQIENILRLGKKMLSENVQLLENVETTLQRLSKKYILLLITKGDLLEQETKIKKSGLSKYFKYIEIVSEKNEFTFSNILKKHKIDPKVFLMVGNSIRSDILPALRIGSHAIHIPYKITWEHEKEHSKINSENYTKLKHLYLINFWLDKKKI